MNSKQITSRQMQATIMMFIIASSFSMGNTAITKQDTWLTFILGALMEVPLILAYCAVIRRYPGDNLFEIIEKLFGKILGKIISLLYIWYIMHLCSIVLLVFVNYIHILNMPETPTIPFLFCMILLCIWSVRSGPENMGRIAKTTFSVLAFFILLTVAISIKDMNFSTIKPVFATDMKGLLTGSYNSFIIPYSEIFIFLTLFPNLKAAGKPKKIFLKSLAISVLLLVAAHLRNVLVLGLPSNETFVFPSYQAVSIISLGEFFTRIEVLIGINLLLAGFTKFCVFLYSASAGLAKIINAKDYKSLTVPCGLLVIILTQVDFKNTSEMLEWINYHQIYVIPFQIILPVIIWVTAEIKARMNKTEPLPEPEKVSNSE